MDTRMVTTDAEAAQVETMPERRVQSSMEEQLFSEQAGFKVQEEGEEQQ